MKPTYTLLTVFLLFCSGVNCYCASAVDVRKPNIIVIFTDDQTYRGVGYNNSEVKTPTLDALAAGGITFEHGYVASPICAASRASMMTGRFPQQHGVMGLGHPAFAPYRGDGNYATQTLPNRLADAGYLTAFFGKSHLGRPKTYGFEVGDELGGHDDVEIFKQATEFIESQPDTGKPFFLWLAPHQPHVPLLPETRWLTQVVMASPSAQMRAVAGSGTAKALRATGAGWMLLISGCSPSVTRRSGCESREYEPSCGVGSVGPDGQNP